MSTAAPTADAASNSASAWASRVRWISWIVAAIALVLLVRALPVAQFLESLKEWVSGFGAAGPFVFAGVYAIWTVAFLPGAPMTIAAGALFGLGWGFVAALTGATAGAAIAFLIGRYLARERVRQMAESRPKLAAVDEAIGEGGWKVVAMLRLSPAFPFNLQNYFYGVSSIGFWTCVLTTAVFMAPGAFLYTYLGHIGAQGLQAASEGGSSGRSTAEWVLLAVGLVATAAVTIYITRLAQKKLEEKSSSVKKATNSKDQETSGASWRSAAISAAVAAVLIIAAVVVTVKPDLVQGWFGPPAAVLAQDVYPENPDGETFDHSKFDGVLSRFVDEQGMVDYEGLRDDPVALNEYISSLDGAPFDALTRDHKLAMLINAYNAFTLKLIIENYPVDSIQDIPADRRWEDKRWKVGDRTFSLNQLEHKEIRPKFAEPRIHFALVCAAFSCPKLRTEAYSGERVREQLEEQTEYVHNHEKWFIYDSSEKRAKLTKLYDWYAGDFKLVADSPLDYAADYAPKLREDLDRGKKVKTDWIEYDWSLNSQR